MGGRHCIKLHLSAKIISLDRIKADEIGDCELLIIDESHNFRNKNTRRYQALKPLTADRELMLLSAAPQNNTPNDIATQILLCKDKDAALSDIPNLGAFFRIASSDEIKSRLLSKIIICRTWRELQQLYVSDINQNALKFTQISAPKNCKYELGGILRRKVEQAIEFFKSLLAWTLHTAFIP